MKNIDIDKEIITLASRSSLNGFIQIISYAFIFGSGIIITRIVGAEIFGVFSVSLSIINILKIISIAGFDRTALKYISFYYGLNNKENIKRSYLISLIFILFTSIFTVLIYYFFLNSKINSLFPNLYSLNTIMNILVFILPFLVLNNVLGNAITSLQKPHYFVFSDGILRIIVQLTLLLVLNLWFSKLYSIIISTCISVFFSFIFLLYKNIKEYHSIKSMRNPILNKSALNYRMFILFSLPLLFVSILNLSTQQFDTILVGHFLNARDVGIYSAVRRIGLLIASPLLVLGGISSATASKLWANNNMHGVQNVYEITTRWIIIVSGFVLIIVFSMSKEVLNLFGEVFIEGDKALKIFAVGQFVNASVGPIGAFLIVLEKQKIVLLNSIISSLLGVILPLILVPKLGILGASLAISITYILINCVALFEIIRIFKLKPFTLSSFFSYLIAIIISIIFGHFLLRAIDGMAYYIKLILSIPILLFVYFFFINFSQYLIKGRWPSKAFYLNICEIK